MKFNEFLKRARENASLTQETASSAIGVGISTIQNWERGSNKPEITILPGISKAYKVPTKTLLEILAEDLDIIDEEAEPQNLKNYQSLLPDGLDYSILNELSFNEIEQEAFLTFAMNVKFSENPISELSKFFIDAKHLAAFLERVKTLRLFEKAYYIFNLTEDVDSKYFHPKEFLGATTVPFFKLTNQGYHLYKFMLNSNKSTFNAYDLKFRDFVDLLETFKIIENISTLVERLEKLTSNESGIIVEEHKKSEKSPHQIEIFKFNNSLLQISDSYYKTEKIENDDANYVEKKNKYLLELEFYKNTPGFEDKLENLKPFNEEFLVKIYPTKKALDFMKEYNVSSM